MFDNIINALANFTLGDFLDILLVTIILYSFFRLIKDTKAYQMAIGIAIVGLLYLITQWGSLVVSNWVIAIFILYLPVAIIVLFQGEIRRFLTTIGSQSLRKPMTLKGLSEKMEDVFLAVDYLAWARAIKGVQALDGGRSPESLVAALDWARAHDGLSLVHVPVYFGPNELGGMGAFGRWNVGNWCAETQAMRHEIGL